MKFEFATATKIIFGAGALREAGCGNGIRPTRAGRDGRNAKRAGPLLKILHEAGLDAAAFSVAGEPDFPRFVRRRLPWRGRKVPTLVISFGGGSALDAGKASPR